MDTGCACQTELPGVPATPSSQGFLQGDAGSETRVRHLRSPAGDRPQGPGVPPEAAFAMSFRPAGSMEIRAREPGPHPPERASVLLRRGNRAHLALLSVARC